ncbi:MAG: CAP domain-containing protein [Acidimicrobiales bacterium]|nr:CAP domain-containing protein [Acidimicrobiales bacterium]
MKFRKPALASITTCLVVATAAAAWAVASPTGISCALAADQSLIAAAPSESAGFVASINNLRMSQGLNALSVDGNISGIAQDWANAMALADGISHRADLRSGITGDWQTLGENVGVGPSVGSLMDAFIASPGHYKNLVDPRFTHVGVGTVRIGGLLYTAHEFMAVRGASAPAPAPAPAPKTAVTSAPKVRTVAAPKAPVVTAPPTTQTPPTTVAPAPTAPTALEAEVEQLPTEEQLDDSGKNNQQKQQSEGNGRCRSHLPNLQAIIG